MAPKAVAAMGQREERELYQLAGTRIGYHEAMVQYIVSQNPTFVQESYCILPGNE